VLVEGISRAVVKSFNSKDYLLASVKEIVDKNNSQNEKNIIGMVRAVKSQFNQYSKLNKKITSEVLNSLDESDDPEKISDIICSNLELKMSSKQELLEIDNVSSRLEKILKLIEEEQGVLQAEKRIRKRVKHRFEQIMSEIFPGSSLSSRVFNTSDVIFLFNFEY
jgi:ATP-dependent Lon protease